MPHRPVTSKASEQLGSFALLAVERGSAARGAVLGSGATATCSSLNVHGGHDSAMLRGGECVERCGRRVRRTDNARQMIALDTTKAVAHAIGEASSVAARQRRCGVCPSWYDF